MRHTEFTPTQQHQRRRLRGWMPRRVTIPEAQHVVLEVDGRLDRVLPTGRHRVWPRRHTLRRLPALDLQQYVVGQEMLTADGAPVRATVVATVKILDPIAVLRILGDTWTDPFHLEVQLALRNVVAELELEQLLDQRTTLDSRLTPLVADWAAARGLEVARVVVRDLVVPGALKQAVANVVAAQLHGRAALERARGETAALRSLANAARALNDNPALLQLRLLQQMETSHGNTFVVGGTLPHVT